MKSEGGEAQLHLEMINTVTLLTESLSKNNRGSGMVDPGLNPSVLWVRQFDSQCCWSFAGSILVSIQDEASSLTRSHPVLGQTLTTTLIDMHPYRQEEKNVSNINTFVSSQPYSFISLLHDTHTNLIYMCLRRILLYSRGGAMLLGCCACEWCVNVCKLCVCVGGWPPPGQETGRGQEADV